MASDPTLSDVKGFLGVTGSTYDTQITAILGAWVNGLNAKIYDEYLADSDLDDILKLGKLLVTCGSVQQSLPVGAVASGEQENGICFLGACPS